MTLRSRVVAYFVAVHVMFAALAIAVFLRNPYWLFAIELVLAISLGVGVALGRSLFRHLGIAAEGLQLIHEREFTSRFREVGQPEVDSLIAVYNRMVDSLRDERTRLQEQQYFLSQVLRVSPTGIVVFDFDRRISDVNPAAERLLDRSAAELTGTQLEDVTTLFGGALASVPVGEARVIGLNGARRIKVHHGSFLDRGFTRSFLLVEELTEELRQFERAAYEKLIRVMSHEVNNTVTASNSLLTSCLTYARELSEAKRVDFEQAVQIVIERTLQLNTFMQRFADVFRLPAPVKRPTRVLDVLQGLVRLLSARPEATRIAWQWELEQRDMCVEMDRGQMEQAFLNVLTNATDAAGPEGTVRIRLTSRDGRPSVMIEDSGPDLTAEAQANLFTPFFSTKPRGQGIGLTFVQEIMAGHGFDYALERPQGGPTRFTFLF